MPLRCHRALSITLLASGVQHPGGPVRTPARQCPARQDGARGQNEDCQWITQLLEHGRPSFVPPQPVRELRELTRYRRQLIQEHTREVNRVQALPGLEWVLVKTHKM